MLEGVMAGSSLVIIKRVKKPLGGWWNLAVLLG